MSDILDFSFLSAMLCQESTKNYQPYEQGEYDVDEKDQNGSIGVSCVIFCCICL
jgi:hypothetical protein